MTLPADQSPPADVCLLLRAHAEARWLSRELVPLIRELEHGRASEPEEDLASAAALTTSPAGRAPSEWVECDCRSKRSGTRRA